MSDGLDSGRQRGDLRVDLKPGRLQRLREVAVLLEMTDAEILRQCVDLALPQLLAQLRASESVSCRQNAAIYGSLAADTVREVRALDEQPSLRVSVADFAAKTPQFTADWRQDSLPLPIPHPHPHTHEMGEGDSGEGINPTAEGVCEGEGSGEGATRRQNAANGGSRRARDRAEFRTWLAAYPRPIGEAAAWRAWQATRRERPPLADLLASLEAQRRSPRWQEGTIPNPGTYLREHRWKDDPRHLTAICRDAKTLRADREARELQAGGERGEPAAFDPGAQLAALAEALPLADPDRDRRAAEIMGLSGAPSQIEAALERIGAQCVASLLAGDPSRADAIEARARQTLAGLRGRLPPGEEAVELEGLRRRIAAKEFQLPALSLYAGA